MAPFCKECGAEYAGGSKFCTECGSPTTGQSQQEMGREAQKCKQFYELEELAVKEDTTVKQDGTIDISLNKPSDSIDTWHYNITPEYALMEIGSSYFSRMKISDQNSTTPFVKYEAESKYTYSFRPIKDGRVSIHFVKSFDNDKDKVETEFISTYDVKNGIPTRVVGDVPSWILDYNHTLTQTSSGRVEYYGRSEPMVFCDKCRRYIPKSKVDCHDCSTNKPVNSIQLSFTKEQMEQMYDPRVHAEVLERVRMQSSREENSVIKGDITVKEDGTIGFVHSIRHAIDGSFKYNIIPKNGLVEVYSSFIEEASADLATPPDEVRGTYIHSFRPVRDGRVQITFYTTDLLDKDSIYYAYNVKNGIPTRVKGSRLPTMSD